MLGEKEMKRFRRRADIAQFLKMQVELTANRGTYGQTYSGERAKPSGDVNKGQEFFQANCVGCHSVTGDLAIIGPNFRRLSPCRRDSSGPFKEHPPAVR